MADRIGRQTVVYDWGVKAFGRDQMESIPQRGARFAEEAIELAQAAGVNRRMMHELVDYIYNRDVGEIKQEMGGVGVTLLALAQAAGENADLCEAAEIARVLSLPTDHFKKRNEAKDAAGFCALEKLA